MIAPFNHELSGMKWGNPREKWGWRSLTQPHMLAMENYVWNCAFLSVKDWRLGLLTSRCSTTVRSKRHRISLHHRRSLHALLWTKASFTAGLQLAWVTGQTERKEKPCKWQRWKTTSSATCSTVHFRASSPNLQALDSVRRWPRTGVWIQRWLLFFFGNPIAHHNFIIESFCTLHLCSEIILDAIFFFGTPNVHHMFIRNSYCTHVWLGVLPVLYITNSVELT